MSLGVSVNSDTFHADIIEVFPLYRLYFLAYVVFSNAAAIYSSAHVMAAAMLRNTIKETSCNVPESIQRNGTSKENVFQNSRCPGRVFDR
jgi:hypothetical protein